MTAASIRYNNPGAMWPGESASKFGSTSYDKLDDGQGNLIAKFDTPEQGAAAQFDLLSSKYGGLPLGQAISRWSGNNSSPQYVQAVSKATGISPDTVITPELLKNPDVAIPLAKAMAKQEAGADYPMTDDQWKSAHGMAFGDAPQPTQANVAANGAINSVSPQTAPNDSSIATAPATTPVATADATQAAPQNFLQQLGSAMNPQQPGQKDPGQDYGASDKAAGQAVSSALASPDVNPLQGAPTQPQRPNPNMSLLLAALNQRKQMGSLI